MLLQDDWSRLIPVGGLLFLIFGTWLCSAHRPVLESTCQPLTGSSLPVTARQHVSWRPVITGILLQVLLSDLAKENELEIEELLPRLVYYADELRLAALQRLR